MPPALIDPDLGYVELAGFSPDGAHLLVVRVSRASGPLGAPHTLAPWVQRTFQVVTTGDLHVEKESTEPRELRDVPALGDRGLEARDSRAEVNRTRRGAASKAPCRDRAATLPLQRMSAGAFTESAMRSPFDPVSRRRRARSAICSRARSSSAARSSSSSTCLVVYCVLRFRASGARESEQVEGNTRLEIAWTIAPILILVWLLVLTVRAMNASDPPIDRDPDVTIIGHQWWWEARYPSGAVTANEIHIPTGKPLVVRLEASDVIHDFWVPELGRKIDATPGRPTSIWLQADHPGTYAGTCAEYCGTQHAWMRILVVAEAPEAFAEWERHQLAPAPLPTEAAATRGATTFNAMTCVRCHAIGSAPDARFAPDLTHLASRTTLGAGAIPNTPTDLTHWLQDPQGIKTGCHMPNAQLTDAQVADLVAYFETLR